MFRNNSRNLHFIAFSCLVWLILKVSHTSAEDAVPGIDFKKMATLPVHLTDDSGNAIAGAEVMPYAMRMKEGGGHGYWNRELLGPPKSVMSNEDGVAVIEYPIHVQSGPRVMTTRLVTFQIKHTDFVRKVVHFDLGPEQADVELKPGCELQISAVNAETDEPIEDFGVVMAGPFMADMWQTVESGGRRTRSINDGTWQTMLVKLQEDGPTLFSGVLPIRVRPKQTVKIRNMSMKPGAVLRGKISDGVPRPVAGYVVATSVPRPAEDSWSETNPSLVWHEWVEIEKDGTFRFASLPRGGKVQLIGICDGWISTTTIPDANFFQMGQLFDMDDESVNVELKMEATGTLEVEVLKPDGEPLTEGEISSWPNQRYFKGGSTLLGRRFRSSDQVRNQLLPTALRNEVFREDFNFPYQQKLNRKGIVILSGIPIGQQEEIYLNHDRFQLAPPDGANEGGTVQFQLPTTKPLKLKVETALGKD